MSDESGGAVGPKKTNRDETNKQAFKSQLKEITWDRFFLVERLANDSKNGFFP